MPVVAAVATVGGSLLAANSAKKAANKAANAQVQSAQLGIEEQRRQYDTTRKDLMPWQEAGQSALGDLGDIIGLNGPEAQGLAISALRASPIYQSLFQNGQNTLLANASATGGLRGGNTQGALANFGRDTLASVIENQVGKLSSVAGSGQNAAAQLGAFGSSSADAIAQLLGQQGAARAGAATAAGGANVAMINSIAGTLGGIGGNSGIQSALGKLF